MARLPQVGGDSGNWGEILNDFLLQSHADTGLLKNDSVSNGTIVDDTIQEVKLSSTVRTKLNQLASSGREVELQKGTTHIEWRYVGDPSWTQLVALAELTGPQGPAGPAGADGADGADGTFEGTLDDIAQGVTNRHFTATNETKLSGIATGATANASDASLQSRANHTGTQTASTISDFNTAADARVSAASDIVRTAGDQTVAGIKTFSGAIVVPDNSFAVSKTTGLQAELDSKLAVSRTITDPATENWASMTIEDDGSATSGWIDRFRVTFSPQSGVDRPTFWLNEYGEFRGMPGKDNTVAGRFFAAIDAAGYTARSGSVPVLEVTDQRDGTRTTIFGVYKGGRVTMTRIEANQTLTANAGTPWISENLNYTIQTSDTDHLRILIQGVAKFWMNEWGAIRGTSPYSWGDALVRAIRDDGDGVTSGRALEVVDRRTGAPAGDASVMWGVQWTDGRMVQGGNLVGAVYTLNSDQDETDIPANLPSGTLIVRKNV